MTPHPPQAAPLPFKGKAILGSTPDGGKFRIPNYEFNASTLFYVNHNLKGYNHEVRFFRH